MAGAIAGYMTEVPSSVESVPLASPAAPAQYMFQQAITLLSSTATVSSATGPDGTYSTSFGGRMIELQGEMTVQVDDSRSASDQVGRLASSMGGYITSSSFDEASAIANVVLRVPEENFSMAMQRVAALGEVQSKSSSSNDVTEQYVNLEAELTSYKTEEVALLRILNSSTTVRDALATQDQIQGVQARINELEGQLRVMHRLVAFATVNVQFTEPPKPSKGPTIDFADALQAAVLSFYIVVKGMLILAASLAPILMIGGIAYLPYRHYSKRKPKPAEGKND